MFTSPFPLIRVLAIAAAVIAIGVTGCGSQNGVPVAAVSGKVTHRNQPVSEGLVSFMSENGFGASASLQADGTFQLHSQHGAGLPHGSYKVIVQPPPLEIIESDRNSQRSSESSVIPRKYQDFATSGLQFDIGAEEQAFDIRLTP